MARGESPQLWDSLPSTLTYSKTENFGHASAGKDLALSLVTTGANAGKVKLAADGDTIIGKFTELDSKARATFLMDGQPMILRKSSAAITLGQGVVGAGNGQVKSSTAAGARGYVMQILETGANGRILVYFPA